jgi:dienelactone hydrolase
MRVAIRSLATTVALCAIAYSASNGAQAHFEANELRELIIGNTVHGENLRGISFKQFFDPSGLFVTEFAGMVLTGTWTIRSDDSLCLTTVATPTNCGVIRKGAGDTYERVTDGTLRARWLKVTTGNSLASASALGEAVSFQSTTFSVASSFVIPLPKEGTEVTIRGFLALPERTDPAPAVILLHGCGGISGTEIGWATTLKSLGIATFIVDSFRGRAIAQTCTRSQSLHSASAISDAYSALELLAVNPRIDRTRIAIMGFSRGGQTALWASHLRFQERFAKGSTRFAAHLAFYPGCFVRLADEERIGNAPVRIFHGAADNWTLVGPCKAYVERLRKAGKDATLIEYANAHHSFDNPGIPLLKLPTVVNLGNCTFAEEDGRVVDAETRGSIFFSTCWSRGASVGYNAAAHRKAVRDVETILSPLFGLKYW